MSFSEQLGYLFKFLVISISSSVFAEVLSTQRRILVILLLVVLIGESLSILKIIAVIISYES